VKHEKKSGIKRKLSARTAASSLNLITVDVLNEEKDYKPRETNNKNPEGAVSFL
jgi:hypothetical protein